jgi:hypothetical protein
MLNFKQRHESLLAWALCWLAWLISQGRTAVQTFRLLRQRQEAHGEDKPHPQARAIISLMMMGGPM